MDATQFDRVAKAVGQGASRRRLLTGLLGVALAGSLGDATVSAKRTRQHHKHRLKAQKGGNANGNSQNAKRCQKGGWATLARAEDPIVPFATQDACVSYGARGGQLVPVVDPFTTTLTGAAEVPGPGDPDGSGTAAVWLNMDAGELCWEVQVSNITLPAAAAHIHVGAATDPGPVVVGLSPPDATGHSSGCQTADRALLEAIAETPQNYYVNVHTRDFPAGAIRGQLG
jgi:hypothetical protein